jgi:DME family drug/metabolite transporter
VHGRDGGFAFISVLAATSLWGTSGPAQVLAHADASPGAVGSARLLVGGVVLGGAALASEPSVRRWFCRGDWKWVALAAASTGVFQAVFFAAVDRTGAALATLVALGAAPVATGLAARGVQREALTAAWLVATVVAIAGCALLLAPGAEGSVDGLGIVFALVAAACYGGYTVAAKRLVAADRPIEGVIAVTLFGGALVLAPALADRGSGLLSARGVMLTGWLALASTALAYTLFVRGLRQVPASVAGVLSLAEPLVAVLLAVVLLGERLGAKAFVGAAVLLVGITLSSLLPLRAQGAPAATGAAGAPLTSGGSTSSTRRTCRRSGR